MSRRNFLRKFMTTSFCVANPEIEQVLDRLNGRLMQAPEAIGNNYAEVEALRMRLAESVALDNPAYICPICHVGVYLACRRDGDEKRFYFKHRVENGNCPAVTRGVLTPDQIEARKYNGVKESDAHRRMKDIVAESLACDPNFSSIEMERVWKGQDRGAWRKPDVQAVWCGERRIAFEIQLSTTFLHVIAQRRLFYQREGGLLCWVFQRFDQNAALMTQDDIFFNNNHNLFLASEQTLDASKDARALVLDCRWLEPAMNETTGMESVWRNKMVRFSELTQDPEQQRIFYFDHDGLRPQLELKVRKEDLRRRFEDWWSRSDWPNADDDWSSFKRQFATSQISLPNHPSALRGLLNGLYSARAGSPVGFRNAKFISVAHNIVSHYPDALMAFRAALMVYDRGHQLCTEDKPKPGETVGKWAKRVKDYQHRIAAGDCTYKPDRSRFPLIAFLFPEVWQQMQAWKIT